MSTPHDVPAPDAGSGDDAVVAEGLRVGASLDSTNLVLVLGDDPRSTALAALGVARAQSGRRRVALGDLLGDAEPIQRLLNTDDPHGLADSFVYGVSLNKIAQAVPQYGELYVLPSGSEVPAYEEIFTNSRWRRLAAGFRETGALLVVAAPAAAAHIADVVDLADGALLVGDVAPVGIDPNKLIGRVHPTTTNGAKSVAREPVTPEPEPTLAFADAPKPWWKRVPIAATIGIVLALGLAGIGLWLAAGPLAKGREPSVAQRRQTASSAGAVPSTLDSLHSDSVAASVAAQLKPADPADSLGAAAFAVVIARYNTRDGATIWLQAQHDLPTPSFAPEVIRGVTWYRALAGSYPTRQQADSLLGALSAKGLSHLDSNNVVRVPFAFLADSVKAEAVPGLLKYFADRGQPVYALRQPDGSARLYFGAYESPEQAALDINTIKILGIRPELVYRIGRVY